MQTTSPGYPNSLNIFSPFTTSNNIIYTAKIKADVGNRLYLLLKASSVQVTAGSELPSGNAMGIRLNFIGNALDLYDNEVQLATTSFIYTDAVWYDVEWIIANDYSMQVRVWQDGTAKPSTATLTESAFTPVASGAYARLSSMPSSYDRVNYWNNFRIRNYSAPDPSIASIGVESATSGGAKHGWWWGFGLHW